ncbi:MAG: LysR family transcriptional regulator [Alphaproteobacteria bacterium]|nr:LysR family transcriptional regulator [Alphaproteobacteria bacterium]
MLRRPYSLPAFSSLVAFEAAARHLSLTRAAAELNVTTGAISKHIKLLEGELGHAVFRRLHRALALTSEGEALAASLSDSFEKLSATFKQLKSSGATGGVSIGTTTAFAQLWLLPRLGAFWAAHQDIIIDHVISDRAQELFRPDVDLRIRYGDGAWAEEHSAKMFDDRIFPVASPAFMRKFKVKSAKDLAGLPLLSVEGADPSWTDWAEFLRATGQPGRKLNLRRFNSYVISLQAAQSGQGVALGWARLVEPLLKSGQLVKVGKAEMAAPECYHVTWSTRKPLSAQAAILKEWLLGSFA